jgi:hypothetical protein
MIELPDLTSLNTKRSVSFLQAKKDPAKLPGQITVISLMRR